MAKRIIPTVNEKLLDRYIRHAVYLEQLKIGEAKRIGKFLKQKTFPQIYGKLVTELSKVKDIEAIGSIYKIRHLKRMLAATHKISVAGMVKAEKMLVGKLINIAKFEANWNADVIKKTVPLDIDLAMPSNEVLKHLVMAKPIVEGHKLHTWMKGYSLAMRAGMMKQLKVGIASGESIPQLSKRIQKVLNIKAKQAGFIARTATSNVVHQAREEVFKKNRALIRKVQWVATLDDRTSLICINLDGKMFDIGDGPRPPIHFNCRSSIIPITPSWQEYGIIDPPPATRASMNGAVPAKTTYRQWIKKQPKSVQVKVLGKKRTELYRSGKVTIDKFTGKNLRPLTLKQLAKREGVDLAPAPPPVIVAKPLTTSNVGTTFTTTVSKEFKGAVQKQIDAYPEKVKLALNDNGISFKAGNKLTEMFPELKGKHPRGWPPGTTWDSVEGMFHLNTNSISISETYRPIRQKIFKNTPKSKIKGILNHETGHGFNRSFGDNNISDSIEFAKAHRIDIKNLSQLDIAENRLNYFLQKGSVGRDETFAEIFADIMGQGAASTRTIQDIIYHDISKFFPNCKKYIEGLLE